MTFFSRIARVAAPIAFAALFGLAACSKDPAPEEPENIVENTVVEDITPEATPPAPEIVNQAPPANVAAAEPIDTTTRDQQMQEDADASGMTARVARDDDKLAADEGVVTERDEKQQ